MTPRKVPMSTLSLHRPSIARICANTMDAVFFVPKRVAHAHDMARAAEKLFATSDEALAAIGTTRARELRRIAQSV